jgi:putative membrane protein
MNEKEQPQSTLNGEKTAAANLTRELEILALVRTRFSSERGLLAWMRTSVSLFTFGFSMIKFFDFLELQQQGDQIPEDLYRLGIVLICVGIMILGPAVGQHVKRLRRAKELGMPTLSRFSLPIGAATTLFLIGATTLIAIVLR